MKIVLDAMGGDHAPEEIVRGAILASRSCRSELILVGNESRIRPLLQADPPEREIQVVHTDDTISMDDPAGPSLRQRKRASMVVAANMVRDGQAQAFVCAGNTAALHQIALTGVGRLPGIKRPALAVVFPTHPTPSIALDMGANADCRPEWLLQWAVVGSVYARLVLGRDNPRVGLLSLGSEEGKGNSLVAAVTPMLKQSGLNFVGNVEPTGFFRSQVDVAVCDGFSGNLILKTGEAVAEWFMGQVRQAAGSSPRARLGGWLLRPALRSLAQSHDHSEHGGAMFLGLRGLVIKCHGRAMARTIENGVRVAEEILVSRLLAQIEQSLTQEAAPPEATPCPTD